MVYYQISIDPEEHSGLPFCSGDGSNAWTSSDAVSVSDSNDGPELLLSIESSCWCWSSTAPSLGWGLPSVMLTSGPSSDSLPSAPEPVDLLIPGDAVFCRGHLVANSELPHSSSLLLLVMSKPAINYKPTLQSLQNEQSFCHPCFHQHDGLPLQWHPFCGQQEVMLVAVTCCGVWYAWDLNQCSSVQYKLACSHLESQGCVRFSFPFVR